MYRSGSRILDILHLSLNLIVIPLIFNRRTYPPSSSRTWTGRPTSDKFILTSCLFPDKYRFPRVAGRLRPRYNRVTSEAATSRACRSSYLSCLSPALRLRKESFQEKRELNIFVKAKFIRFSSDDRNKLCQMNVSDTNEFLFKSVINRNMLVPNAIWCDFCKHSWLFKKFEIIADGIYSNISINLNYFTLGWFIANDKY